MLKTLVKQTSIYGISGFLIKLIGFCSLPIFTRYFSVEEYGSLALATTFGMLIMSLSRCGLSNSLHRYYFDPDILPEKKAILMTTGLLMQLVLCFATTGIFVVGSRWVNPKWLELYGLDIGLLWVVILGNVPQLIFFYLQDAVRMYLSPWVFSILGACASLGSVALSLYFVIEWKWGILGPLAGNAIGFMLALPLSFWVNRKNMVLDFDVSVAKRMLLFGYPFIFTEIAYWIFGSMDRWMLSSMSDLTQTGLYSCSFRFCQVILFLSTAFSNAWSVQAMKLYGEQKNYREIYSRCLTYWFFLLVFLAGALGLYSKEIVSILIPREYSGAVESLPYLAMGYAICGIQTITAIGISLKRKTYHMTLAAWMAASVNFSLNTLFIPSLGAKGAAIATIISYVVLVGYYTIALQKLHPIPLEYRKLTGVVVMIPILLLSCEWTQSWDLTIGTEIVKPIILLGVVLFALLERIVDWHQIKGLILRPA